MERGRLMLSPDTLEEDMAVMVVMAMEDMVIAVKFFPLFIVPLSTLAAAPSLRELSLLSSTCLPQGRTRCELCVRLSTARTC